MDLESSAPTRRMRWAEHLEKNFSRKMAEISSLRISKRRREDNIKLYGKIVLCEHLTGSYLVHCKFSCGLL
jgi:hypothetical protein